MRSQDVSDTRTQPFIVKDVDTKVSIISEMNVRVPYNKRGYELKITKPSDTSPEGSWC